MIFYIILILIILLLLYNNKNNNKYINSIKTLTRQCARWAVAAQQDKNIIIATLHSNYATGYLWALNDIATADDIYKYTGVDYLKLKKEVTKIQDDITVNLHKLCPKYSPKKSFLMKIAKEG